MKARPPLPPEIKELMQLVRGGKLFAVQKWIADGKPVTPPDPYWFSPLRVAVKTGFHSMIELLLQQGVETDELDYLLSNAVWDGNFEIIQLLVEYGADIRTVDFEDVCRTGHPFIIHYFLDRGIDADTGYPFALALRYPKKRYLGVFMRYRDKIPSFRYQINLALRYHAQQGNLKWVSLLMWAGGDPHLLLPEIEDEPDPEEDTSAIEEASARNHIAIVDRIGIDLKRDNINRMFEIACLLGRSEMIEKLVALGVKINGDNDSGEPMDKAIFHLSSEMEEHWGVRSPSRATTALALVLRVADLGARWIPSQSDLRRFRRLLCHFEPDFIQNMIEDFEKHKVCSVDALYKIVNTKKFKAIFGQFRWSQLKAKVNRKDRA